MRNMDALSIRYNSSHSTDREQACVGDSHASSGIDFACTTTQRVLAIASPHELHGDSLLSSSTGTSSFCCNQQYSITAVTTSAGAIAERYAYTAYGQPTILDPSASILSSSAINNRYSYTGCEWDATVGLHHFRARWMSPKTGRFLGRDPIGFVGGQFSVYAYVGASPLRYVDPLGLQAGDPDPSIPFLFGNPLGDFLQGNITGVCYEVLWKVDIKLLDVNYFGGGNAIWLVLRPFFDRSITGGGRRMCADCCMLSMTDIDFKGTRSFILQDVVVPGLPFQPDPGVKIGISGSIIINLGVCVKPGCKCPPSNKRKESIDFGDLDLGTIKYSDLMKRIPK